MSLSQPTLAARVLAVMARIGRRALHLGSMVWQWLRIHTFQPAWLPAQWRHPITGYLIAFALAFLSVMASWFMVQVVPRYMFVGSIPFLITVFLAFTFGAGPSLFGTFVSIALLWIMVLPPSLSWSLGRLENVVGLTTHLVVGVSVAILASRVEQARQQAVKERTIARQLSARLQTTLDVLPVGVGIAEASGDLTLTNRAFQAVWGEPSLAAPTPLSAPSGPPGAARHVYHGWRLDGAPIATQEWGLARAMRDGVNVLNEEIEIATSAGERRSVLYSAAPIHNAQGVVDGGVVVILDITERRNLERRTHVALTTLLAMAEALTALPPQQGQQAATPPAPTEPWERARERAAIRQVLTLTQHLFGGQYASVTLITRDARDSEAVEPLVVVGLAPDDEQRWWRVMGQARDGDLLSQLDLARLNAEEQSVVQVERQPLAIPGQGPGQSVAEPRSVLLAALRLDAGRLCLVTMEVAERVEVTPQDFELAMAAARLVGSLVEQERVLREREEARAMVLALEESTRRMDAFLALASHELRTPLTSATLCAQRADRLLRQWLATEDTGAAGELQTEQVATLHMLIAQIQRQMARQERLVGDLLDVSRLQISDLELRSAPCDLVDVVQQAIDEQRLLHPGRVITLDLATGDERVMVMGDADRIGQAVSNYLSNALKYSLEHQAVRVSLDTTEQMARVRVQDMGVGIPVEAQAHLWERFYRVSGVAVQSGSGIGLGLGLYITRSIIERLGGQVGVMSAPGTGATFWFTLPRIHP